MPKEFFDYKKSSSKKEENKEEEQKNKKGLRSFSLSNFVEAWRRLDRRKKIKILIFVGCIILLIVLVIPSLINGPTPVEELPSPPAK